MDFDCVISGILRQPCGKFKTFHHLCNFFLGHGMTFDLRIEYGRSLGRGDRRIAKCIRECVSSCSRTDLADNFCSISVNTIADRSQRRQDGVGIKIPFHGTLCNFFIQHLAAHKNNTGAAFCPLDKIVNFLCIFPSVCKRRVGSHRRHADPVFDFHISYFKWCKKFFVSHKMFPPVCILSD